MMLSVVLLHEFHHAQSAGKGFLDFTDITTDGNLLWKFDEAATEYFTKQRWDELYPDQADEYFQHTNYFKDQGGKTGWFGEVVEKWGVSVPLIRAAYFQADAAARAELVKNKGTILATLRGL